MRQRHATRTVPCVASLHRAHRALAVTGLTALMSAIRAGHLRTVEVLCASGADTNLKAQPAI
jgi:hypothetical protein